MKELHQHFHSLNRRNFLRRSAMGLGAMALSGLLQSGQAQSLMGLERFAQKPHFPPKVKRVIYLFQSGAPSQLELFDYKPLLRERHGRDLPASIRNGQRLTGMTSGQKRFPLAGSYYDFKQYGQNGTWMSELLPHTASVVDELCVIRSMYTEAINHDPAVTFIQTGSQHAGRPSIGSWLSYGLGSDNQDLPAFVVLISRGKEGGQPLYSRLWGNGFLPSIHQGVQFRSGKDPVLYLNNPDGIDPTNRRRMLDYLQKMQEQQLEQWGDPEIATRIAQYEMAYRMQSSVPDTMSLDDEPDYIFDLYGKDARIPGTFAANCLLARRLAERDVKFVQLYHMGWDQHSNLPTEIAKQARDVDQASAALIKDLKQRGLLEDTLVVWGGEFGRTNYSQGKLQKDNYGRDHHPRCFSLWMAGAGVKKGISYGQTDEFGYNVVKDPVHVHDFQATLLHLLGIDHERLTFKFQGRRYRLTDVHGKVVKDILA